MRKNYLKKWIKIDCDFVKQYDVRKNDAMYELALEVLEGLSVKDAKNKLSKINRRFI